MGLFTNEVEPTGGLKIERVVTVPITIKYSDLDTIGALIEDAPFEGVVKGINAGKEQAELVITQTGYGVAEEPILRALDETGIRYVVGRVKTRRADQAGTDED